MMPISLRACAAIEHLNASASDLVRDLATMESGPEADAGYGPHGVADMVKRYLAILVEGWSEDDAVLALKGANLLTGVNKGVADTDLGQAMTALGPKAFTVTKDAIDAARYLRMDAGMAF